MAGSQSTGGSGDEQGTLIRFPRSKWVPDDGIQPLDTGECDEPSGEKDAAVADDVDESAVQRSRSPAIEATDFWATGDTQEFVAGAATAPRRAGAAARNGNVELARALKQVGGAIWRHRLMRPVAVGLALVAVVALGLELATQHRAQYLPVFKSASVPPGNALSGGLGAVSVFSLRGEFERRFVARRPATEPWHRARGRTGSTRARASGSSVIAVRYSTPVGGSTNAQASAPSTTYQAATYSAPVTTATLPTTAGAAAATASDVASSPPPISHPAGPAGPGYVIGSNCNPKCR